MKLYSLLVRAVGEANPVVEDARLRAEEVTAPSPSTPVWELAVCHRDPLPTSLLRRWVVEAVLG
jgi:hypothetical protein